MCRVRACWSRTLLSRHSDSVSDCERPCAARRAVYLSWCHKVLSVRALNRDRGAWLGNDCLMYDVRCGFILHFCWECGVRALLLKYIEETSKTPHCAPDYRVRCRVHPRSTQESCDDSLMIDVHRLSLCLSLQSCTPGRTSERNQVSDRVSAVPPASCA